MWLAGVLWLVSCPSVFVSHGVPDSMHVASFRLKKKILSSAASSKVVQSECASVEQNLALGCSAAQFGSARRQQLTALCAFIKTSVSIQSWCLENQWWAWFIVVV